MLAQDATHSTSIAPHGAVPLALAAAARTVAQAGHTGMQATVRELLPQ